MRDPAKISAKLRALGSGWVEAEGYHALTTVNYGGTDPIVFNPSVGIPVKVFFNSSTGEIKLFLARNFEVS